MALKNKRKPSGNKWGVVDNGEIIFIAATRAEAKGMQAQERRSAG